MSFQCGINLETKTIIVEEHYKKKFLDSLVSIITYNMIDFITNILADKSNSSPL
jgi:hypothetical protein